MRIVSALLGGFAALAHAQDVDLKLSGSYKAILLRSETLAGEAFTLDINRLRVEVKGNVAPAVAVDLQYDNEVLLGSYLHTGQFAAQKDALTPQYWRAQSNYVDASQAYGTHRLYRAAVTLAVRDVDVRVGRQRIAWGTGRFWSPLDILNPVSPTAVEREDRLGVDAVLVEAKFDALSRLSAVHAPQRDAGRTTNALQWHGNVKSVDYSLVGGRMLGQDVVGFDLAGQLGQAGVRAEATRQRPAGGTAFSRVMVGADYAFANTLTVSTELYYNGGGTKDRAAYDFGALASGRTLTLATRYLGLFAGYELTPLLKWNNYLVVNLDDRSRALDSRLIWSLRSNLDMTFGLQRFGGSRGSEYAQQRDSMHVRLQWFF